MGRPFSFIIGIVEGILLYIKLMSLIVPIILDIIIKFVMAEKDKRIYFIHGKHVVRFWEEKSKLKGA